MAPAQKEISLPGDPPFFQKPNAEKLIVFVHGLTGDPVTTWSSDGDSPFFWPEQLAKDSGFENTDVFSFGYTSDVGAPLNIPQLAQHLQTTLSELNRFIQYQSISFVAHSLGGLVVRHFILDHFQEMKIGTVVLLSTPNFGHHMSRVAKLFSANAHLDQLDPGPGNFIDGLNDKWRKEFREKRDRESFRMAAGYELFPMFKKYIKVGIIVEKYAAVNFASHTQAFEDDHERIAKPKSESDLKYIWVRQQLLELPRDPRNREYSEAEEKRFEEIIDELQKELAGTDLEEALELVAQGKLDDALTLLSVHEDKEDEQVLKSAKTRFAKAKVYELKLDFKNAFKYYEKAVLLAPENSLYQNDTGTMALTLGQFEKAIGYFEKALAIDLKTVGTGHPHVAIDWNNLGEAYRAKGEYNKAIGYLELALASDMKTFGPENPQVATYWNNLGLALSAKGENDKAIRYLEKAQEINLNILEPDHPSIAATWSNLGAAWDSKGKPDKAIEYYEMALTSGLKNLGPHHPDVATRWNNLGNTLRTKGEYNKAIDYLEKALASDLENFGPENPRVATIWNNLGNACYAKQDYDLALDYYEKALASDLKTLGPEHPQVAIYWNNLGLTWNSKGESNKAIGYYEKALASDLKTFSPDHPNVANCWNNLGGAWYSKGNYKKAIKYFKKAREIWGKAGLDHKVKIAEDNLSAARRKKDEQ